MRLMSSGGVLYFGYCEWTDAEVKQLVAALQYVRQQGGGTLSWIDVIRACKANRLAPLTPPEFEKLMTDGMASGKINFTVRRLPSNRRPVSWC